MGQKTAFIIAIVGTLFRLITSGISWARSGGNTVVLKTDGILWNWGSDWPNVDKNPERIGTDTNWRLFTLRGLHIVAQKSDNSFGPGAVMSRVNLDLAKPGRKALC